MTSFNPKKAVPVVQRVHWVGSFATSQNLHCHPYFIENGDTSVLIDPGSAITVDNLLDKLRDLTPLHHIKYLLLHHHDPDIATALPLLEREIARDDLVVVTHSLTASFLKHYGITSDIYEANRHGFALKTDNGLELTFAAIPYCHAPGAFVTYYARGNILFSGDLFSGFSHPPQLFADGSSFEGIEAFHRLFMPSRDILNHALNVIEPFDPDVIAPQHGSILRKPLIRPLIERLKRLECGLHTTSTYRKNLTHTARRLEEERLKNELILEASPNAVIAVNEHKEVILFNKRAERMFGYSREEMIGSYSLPKIIPDVYLKAHTEGLERFLSCETCTDIRNRIMEYEAVRKNGEHFPIRINFGVDRNNEHTIIVATIQDISDEKLQKEIVQRHIHMAQMGEMLGMITHQWRQPLSAVAMSAQVLAMKARKGTVDTKTVLSFTEKIGRYTDFLYHTVDDFRTFFKPDNLPAPTNFRKILDIVLPIVMPQFQSRGIDLKLSLRDTETFVTYGGELKQVLLNLLKNAVDVFEERCIASPQILIETESDGEQHRMIIEDNAGGVSTHVMERMFDLFYTTKDEKRGTGMGLYMSKVIVEEHCKGTLSVENTSDGARFTIAVPSLEKDVGV